MYNLSLIIITIFFCVVWKLKQIYCYWKNQGIFYEKPWPIIGNMLPFLKGKYFGEFLEDIYKKYDARYFGMYTYMKPVLIIKDIDLIKQFGIKDFNSFIDHKGFSSQTDEPVYKENLFALKGEKWRRMRTILSPTFTGSKMRIMFNLMRDCAEQFVNYCSENSNPNKDLILQTKDAFCRYSNDVIATCAFGVSCDSLRQKKNEFFLRGQDVGNFGGIRAFKHLGFLVSPTLMNFFGVRLFSESLINFFRDLVVSAIGIREKENIYRPDMIHLLMEARKGKLKRDEFKENDESFVSSTEINYNQNEIITKYDLTDDEIAGQALIFLLAGFETSSTTLSFMSYELALNKDIQTKLQQEIDEVMEECNNKVTYEAVTKMIYLDMVITETLRLWSPVYYVDRVCNSPYTIEPQLPNENPITLNIDDIVWFPIHAIHRDPKHYPDPLRFNPERFSPENRKNINPCSFLPFGIGPRNCIGFRFALLEIKVLMVYLLNKFDINIVQETQIPPQIDAKQMLLATTDGIKLGFSLRKK